MADSLSNTCEGTSGVTVSISNSAGPDQFDAVTLSGAGATQVWDNAQAHAGSTSMKLTFPASVATLNYVAWTTSISPTPVANAYIRFYVYLTAYPTVNAVLFKFLGGTSVPQVTVKITTAGLLQLINEVSGIVATTTAAVPLNGWCRVEADCTANSGTTANLAVRMFSGAELEGITPDSGGSVSASAQTTTALVNAARIGDSSLVTETSAWSTWLDDIAFSDTASPGPAGSSVAAGQASGTGTAQDATGTPAITGSAGLATGTAAAAQDAGPAAGVTAGLATGTATAQPVAMTIAVPVTATGTGTAQDAGPAAGVTAGLAQGTGTAQNPAGTPAVAPAAGLAAGTAGRALDASVSTSGNTNVTAGLAAGTGTALDVSMATPTADLATGTGSAQDAGTSFSLTAAGFATGTGTAQPAFTVTAGLATGTGTAQDATGVPAITATAGLATGTGTALGIGQSASFAAGRATGTAGTAQDIGQSASFAAGLSTGTGTAFGGDISSIVSPVLTGYGFGSFPQVPAGAVVLSVVAAVVQFGSNAGIGVPAYQLWDGTAAQIGLTQFGTASTTAGHTDSVVFTGVSYSQLATLQLRIYATSQSGNSGATVSVDAVSLSVSWAPGVDAAVAPAVLAVVPALPALLVSVTASAAVTPDVLAIVPVFPDVAAGFEAAAIFPGALAVIPVAWAAAAAAGALITPGVLAIVPAFPAITDITVPGWATADSSGGSWANPGNILGPPDGQSAVWTVP